MRVVFLAMFYLLTATAVTAQIPNGSFEEWDTSSAGVHTPKYWDAYGDWSPGVVGVHTSSDSYSGNYALKMAGWAGNQHSDVWCIIDTANILSDTIYFNAKLTGYQSSDALVPYIDTNPYLWTYAFHMSGVNTTGYNTFAIPIPKFHTETESIQFGFVNAVNSYPFNTLIDSVSFSYQPNSSSMSVSEVTLLDEFLFQDGCSFRFSEAYDGRIREVVLYDITGKRVQDYNPRELSHNLSGIQDGTYVVRCVTDLGVVSFKILRQCEY